MLLFVISKLASFTFWFSFLGFSFLGLVLPCIELFRKNTVNTKNFGNHPRLNFFFTFAGSGLVIGLGGIIAINDVANEEDMYQAKGQQILIYPIEANGVKNGVLTNAIFQVSASGQEVQFASGNLQLRSRDTAFIIAKEQYEYGDLLTWPQAHGAADGSKRWRLLTAAEWEYIVLHYPSKWAKVNGTPGLIIVPSTTDIPLDSNEYDVSSWYAMQAKGAVFLPAAGKYDAAAKKYINEPGTSGFYRYESGPKSRGRGSYVFPNMDIDHSGGSRYGAVSVRLVENCSY